MAAAGGSKEAGRKKTRMAAPKCATEKKFRQSSRTKSNDVILRTIHSRTTGSRINDPSPRFFIR